MSAVKHAKTSVKGDGADATLVQPTDWNADHTIDWTAVGDLAAENFGVAAAAGSAVTVPHGDHRHAMPTANAYGGLVLWFDNVTSDLVLPSVTGTVYAAVNSNPDTITRSSGSFIADGFIAGQKITTSGFADGANNGTFCVVAVATDTLTLATIHALTARAAGATVTISTNRERLTRTPASGSELDESQSIVLADGDVPLDCYCTPALVPGATVIPAGLWEFHAYAYVSSTSGTTALVSADR